MPAPPGRFAAQAKQTAIRAEDRVRFSVKVFLFEEDITPVSRGDVGVEVDLRNANPSSGRLLYLFEPDAEVAPHWDRYREVFEMSISEYMRLALGNDEIAAMTYEIVLGSVDSGMIERLRDAATSVQPLDLTPTQKRPHTATPEPATPAA